MAENSLGAAAPVFPAEGGINGLRGCHNQHRQQVSKYTASYPYSDRETTVTPIPRAMVPWAQSGTQDSLVPHLGARDHLQIVVYPPIWYDPNSAPASHSPVYGRQK